MKFLRTLFWMCALTASALAQSVTFLQTAVNDADGTTISAVSSSQVLQVGATATSVTAPATSGTYHFAYWTESSRPATVYRDGWGRAVNPISFTMLGDTTAVAHYLPTTQDYDGDGIPDWYEIEYYGNLSHSATYDGDGDGITLLAEYTAGTNPLYADSSTEGGTAWADSATVTVNLANYASYTLRSIPAGTVAQTTTIAPPGTVVTTPSLAANTTFGYWTLDGVRQQDAWGVALPQITFTMGAVNREAVAYLFSGDSNGNGVPDAYEYYYYGDLSHAATYDGDGDGITLLAEYTGGTNPLYGNSSSEGGVAWADSATVTVNIAGYSTYTLRSIPAGTVNQSATVAPGTVVTTPSLAANTTFGYWTLDGVRQQDAWGVALPQITFTMGSTSREAVAYLFTGDSDGDGVPDAYEYYYYGTLANGANSDTDGDGITLLAEYTGGTNPLYANSSTEGGVAWADSAQVTVKLVFPVLTLPASPVVVQTSSATGAVVIFTVTAYDAVEGQLIPTTTPASGSLFPVGTTTVNASVSDSLGNLSTGSFEVLVQYDGIPPDTTPPVVAAHGNAIVHATSPAGAVVIYAPASATDNVGVTSITYSQNSGTLFPLGTTVVTITARDAANNAGTGTFSVTVNALASVASWRYEHFGTTENTGNAADLADWDHDGVVNILEMAFGTDPTSGASGPGVLQYTGTFAGGGAIAGTGQPVTRFESIPNGIDFRALFVRRTDYATFGLIYTPQFSADMLTWQDSTAIPTVLADDGTYQIVSVPYPPFINGKKARFFRIRISLAP